jgi:hypothetical protein
MSQVKRETEQQKKFEEYLRWHKFFRTKRANLLFFEKKNTQAMHIVNVEKKHLQNDSRW